MKNRATAWELQDYVYMLAKAPPSIVLFLHLRSFFPGGGGRTHIWMVQWILYAIQRLYSMTMSIWWCELTGLVCWKARRYV